MRKKDEKGFEDEICSSSGYSDNKKKRDPDEVFFLAHETILEQLGKVE